MMSVPQALAMAWQFYQAGQLQQAEQLFRQILQADSFQVDVWHHLGLIALRTGRGDLAVDCFQETLRLRPDHVSAHNDLGWTLQSQGKLAEAVIRYQEALRLKPDYAEAHYNLGNVLHGQGKLAEAAACYESALRLRPDLVQAHNNLGNTLQQQEKFDEAAASLEGALRLKPDYPEARFNLACVQLQQGKLSEAEASFEAALRLKPDHAESYYNLANVLQQQGKFADAVANLESALRLKPDFSEAHYYLGTLSLLQGDFEGGWPEYEWRWQTKEYPSLPRPGPPWDGSPLDGKTALLYAEQGTGDVLQFIRYAGLVKERGATVVAECPAALLDVLAGCPGIDRLLPPGAPLPAYDVQAALLSLPGRCGTTLATIPAKVPYLVADRSRVACWQARLAGASGYKVGICWQGNPSHKHDRRRSVPLAEFGPLAEVPGIRLVCLQHGPGREQWDKRPAEWPVVDLPSQVEEPSRSWVETAALVCALDLVITVDTAVAHLAGALGVPVWVALPFRPDWRWLLEREDSPWYPSMRLFRQAQPGDWPDVFQRITAALQTRLERGSPANP